MSSAPQEATIPTLIDELIVTLIRSDAERAQSTIGQVGGTPFSPAKRWKPTA